MLQEKSRLIVREKSDTDSDYGCFPHERKIKDHIDNGIVIVDKPAGPTSHQVAAWTREILGVKKVGHAGTLDPNVTGVLPSLINNSTKITSLLLTEGKEYVFIMKLHEAVSKAKIREAVNDFIGTIIQMPPVKSAVKRRLRQRNIYSLEILDILDKDVLLRADVQAGTYIRTLCVDLGKNMGIKAHMDSLRRIRAGPFIEMQAVTLHDLKDAYETWKETGDESGLREIIKPVEFGVKHVKKLLVKDSTVAALCYGAPLHVGGISQFSAGIQVDDAVAVMTLKGELVGIGNAVMMSEDIASKKKGVAAVLKRIMMDENIYPRAWK
ncbi:MAG: RNA-guided pseudouridylation complex pseudouridine synthase subunit Cbf5 [archaeon]|nr:RNA-guided pseudouridylation complex pseudouridine synthase subunit Cbf5 [archaeon]